MRFRFVMISIAIVFAILLVAALVRVSLARVWPADDPDPDALPWERILLVTVPEYRGLACEPDSTAPLNPGSISNLVFEVKAMREPGEVWLPVRSVGVAEFNSRGDGLVFPGDTLAVWIDPPDPGLYWLSIAVDGSPCWSDPILGEFPSGIPDPPVARDIVAPVLASPVVTP